MLSIPKNCKEDFSKMTSTERGAFCGKCQIDTFDFTQLTNQQINKSLFLHKDEHLCGRFHRDQIASLNRDFLNWKKQRPKTLRSKFLLAVLIVFGLTLFSCEEKEETKIQYLQQLTIQKISNPSVYVNDVKSETELDLRDYTDMTSLSSKKELENEERSLHELSKAPIEIKEFSIQNFPVEELTDTCNGSHLEITRDDHNSYYSRDTLEYHNMILGGIMIYDQPELYQEYLEEIVVDSSSTIDDLYDYQNQTVLFETAVFPNPTVSDAKLNLNIKKEGQFEIVLLDMSGRVVQVIYSGLLAAERNNFDISLENERSGLYFIKVVSANQHEILKLQKLN